MVLAAMPAAAVVQSPIAAADDAASPIAPAVAEPR